MGTQNSYAELGPYAANEIKALAAQLVKQEGFSPSDCADVEQDLAVDLLRRTPNYNPQRSTYEAFVAGVLQNSVRMLIAARKAGKRDYRRRGPSLNETVLDADEVIVLPWNDADALRPYLAGAALMGLAALWSIRTWRQGT